MTGRVRALQSEPRCLRNSCTSKRLPTVRFFLVGELSFMDDEPRYGTLLASGPTKVLCLSRADFETLVETEPRVVYKVMRTIMRVAHRVQRNVSRELQDLQNYVYRTGAKI
jgi:CRP/FNR family transcriptional regulator, cyclic AMP receptor protein